LSSMGTREAQAKPVIPDLGLFQFYFQFYNRSPLSPLGPHLKRAQTSSLSEDIYMQST